MCMQSQIKWGSFFIITGLVIIPTKFPFTLLYSIPLLCIGSALLIFRKREEIIEECEEIGGEKNVCYNN